jgi:hypothetical protein
VPVPYNIAGILGTPMGDGPFIATTLKQDQAMFPRESEEASRNRRRKKTGRLSPPGSTIL